jgi:hypothetical protein
MTIQRLDAVSTFNDKLSFLIPHEWIEVESGEDGTYQYQLPDARSGFFRVSLITANGPAGELKKRFEEELGNVEINPVTGNFIARSEKALTQDGAPIHIYYWFVGGSLAPNAIREAVFSYTILAELVNDTDTQSDVKIIGQLAADARFDRPMSQ